jgi:protein-disulfide isomerase
MEKGTVIGILVGGIALGGALGAGTMKTLSRKDAVLLDNNPCSTATQPLVTVEGKTFTQNDLPLSIQGDITRIQNQSYDQLTGYLKETALRMVLAKEKGKDVNNPPPLMELLDGSEASEQEINSILEAQKKNLPAGMKIEDAKKQIATYISRQKAAGALEQKLAQFEQDGKIKVLVNPPFARALSTEGQPSRGSATSAVKVVIVTDFLCGHCRHREEEFEAAVTENADKVQVTRMTFSLSPEGLSGTLARGAFCALKQSPDLYWKYHAGAKKVPLEAAHSASPEPTKEFNNQALGVAKEAGLDVNAFEKCLASQEAQDFVKKTNDNLAAAGVNGTPTIFINGARMQVNPGKLSAVIKDALAKSAK